MSLTDMFKTETPMARPPLSPTLYPALCLAAHLGLAPLAAGAQEAGQNVLITTGEHGEFTRLVLQSSQPIDWSLDDETGSRRALHLPSPALQLDLSRAFRRIGRNRLAGLEQGPDGLVLELACDCSIRAWQERPGLVVLDIHDGPATPEQPAPSLATAPEMTGMAAQPMPTASLPGATPTATLPSAIAPADLATDTSFARNAGTAIARDWAEQQAAQTAAPQAAELPVEAQLEIARELARQVAGAMGQGLLDPAIAQGQRPEMVLPGEDDTTSSAMTPNLRISSVLDRPDLQSLQLPETGEDRCIQAHTLDEMLVTPGESFNTSQARLMRNWLGEFDIPDPEVTEALARLYLQHGFGAEARAMLENSTAPVPGRDLLLGFSDILENRHSNSRLRLAEQLQCGGITSMLAALAGAPPAQIRARATEIAIAFAQTPGTLRAILGQDLVSVLVEAGATESARVVADTLRRTADIAPPDMALIDSLLDRARGDIDTAAERLDHARRDDVAALQTRLDLALQRGENLAPSMLENAEAMAASLRATSAGERLKAAVIRLYATGGEADRALEGLDRMRQWPEPTPARRALEGDLSDAVWLALAEQLDDAAFLALTMARADWRQATHSPETRTALAERLLDFGLADMAAPLLEAAQTPAANRQLARLLILRNDPQAALDALGEDMSDSAQRLRADALHAIGATNRASALLAEAGALEEARRMATASADWAALQEIGLHDGQADHQALARALSSTPGQFRAAPAAADSAVAQPREDTGAPAQATEQAGGETTLASADPLTPGMLQHGTDLLSESEALRDTLGALLAPQNP